LNIENLPARSAFQEWLHTHIDNLAEVQRATLARERTYAIRDIDPSSDRCP